MSRARKVKKAARYFEYEITDRYGEVVVWCGGLPTERLNRLDRMDAKRHIGMAWGWLAPAPIKHRR